MATTEPVDESLRGTVHSVIIVSWVEGRKTYFLEHARVLMHHFDRLLAIGLV